jgi:hypothetical protein
MLCTHPKRLHALKASSEAHPLHQGCENGGTRAACDPPVGFVWPARLRFHIVLTKHSIQFFNYYDFRILFIFFLHGAAAHIGPWPPLYKVLHLTLIDGW